MKDPTCPAVNAFRHELESQNFMLPGNWKHVLELMEFLYKNMQIWFIL